MRIRRGFTLIELLIVVAIISILSAATLSMLVLPMREQAIGEAQVVVDRGLARTLPRLMEDAREATRADVDDGGVLRLYGEDDAVIMWYLDDGENLRRQVAAAGLPPDPLAAPAVMHFVKIFEPSLEENDSTLIVRLEAGFERMQQPYLSSHTLRVTLAPIWRKQR